MVYLFNIGKNGVHLSRDGKVLSVISKSTIKMIETNTFRDLARINLKDFIPIERSILITSIEFFDDFSFGIVTVQGHVIVMHYPSGTVFFTHIPEVCLIFRKLLISPHISFLMVLPLL